MSAPAVIDCLEFARSGQTQHGSLPVASLRRLEDALYDSEGDLDYELKGTRDERNRPQLSLTIEGHLHLQCQRCLGPLHYAVEIANTLLVLSEPQSDQQLADPEAPDAIESSPELDVAGLIEDEVLLSLPLAPRHPAGVCTSRLAQRDDSGESKSAFAKLASLKNAHKR